MGYSIAIRCHDKVLRKKMNGFMKRNWKSPSYLFPNHEPGVDYVDYRNKLDYDRSRYALGYNYSVLPHPDYTYVWSSTCWMAKKINEVKKFAIFGERNYVVYDGDSYVALLPYGTEIPDLLKVPENQSYSCCDDLGCKFIKDFLHKGWIEKYGYQDLESCYDYFKLDELIHDEIKKLDLLWNKS
jgi:hypothetical protein